MYDLIAKPLQFFYELWPNYAGAISLLTLTIMILLLPLTLKGTRSMLAMQKLQPELKKIQAKYKDDRQQLNEQMMLFYKENNINPVSGCLPLLLQMPVFVILYRTLFQLLNRQPFGYDMGAASARAKVELGIERLDLLQQPVDQLLGAADRQRRDVVYRLVRIELGALATRSCQGVEQMRLDAEQAELEHLEQTTGARTDDHDFGTDRLHDRSHGGNITQGGVLWSLAKTQRILAEGRRCRFPRSGYAMRPSRRHGLHRAGARANVLPGAQEDHP